MGETPLQPTPAERLAHIDLRLAEIAAQRSALEYEHWRLQSERRRVLWDASAASRPPGSTALHEWRPERVRDVLLWLGAALLALAALAFTVVAWAWLGDGGRAALLVLTTAAVALATGIARRRLPATAEALAALVLALVAVDCVAARRAGIAAGMSIEAWFALVLAITAGAGLALGVVGRLRAGQLGAAVLSRGGRPAGLSRGAYVLQRP